MRHGRPTDYEPPFIDFPHPAIPDPMAPDYPGDCSALAEPGWQAEIGRLAGIGPVALLSWWERVKHDTHPGTYGHHNHHFTSHVAYLLANVAGRPPPPADPFFEAAHEAHRLLIQLSETAAADPYLAAGDDFSG